MSLLIAFQPELAQAAALCQPKDTQPEEDATLRGMEHAARWLLLIHLGPGQGWPRTWLVSYQAASLCLKKFGHEVPPDPSRQSLSV